MQLVKDSNQVYSGGINLNQLARKANTLNFIDKDEYKKQAEEWKSFSNKIKNKYL